MPISVTVPGDTPVDDANSGIGPGQCPDFNSAMTYREATTYMCGQSEDDTERKAEMCSVTLTLSWLESRVIRLGVCFDDFLRRLWKIFDKVTYIEQT